MNKTGILILMLLLCCSSTTFSQCISFNPGGDTTKTVTFEGYTDVYFGFDFNQPKDANRPYSVTQHRHNEFNINLAYFSMKFNSSRARAVFTPGFGTYMNANYATERVTLKNIIEANVGVKLFKEKNIWLDVGVIGSPYTTESAVSFDQLLYTRSFAAEYSPYYLTGAKLALPLTNKINLYLYLINGWQVIEDTNTPLAFSSWIEIKPNSKIAINWSTYFGSEQSAAIQTNRSRYFSDLNCIYSPNKRLTMSVDVYGGIQNRSDSLAGRENVNWWQGNSNARYYINEDNSISARAEYYSDKQNIFITPVTGESGFDCTSYSLGFNRSVTQHVLFRLEGRYFQSTGNVFLDNKLTPINTDAMVIAGLIAKF
jgi:hypothetical protein